MSMNIRFPNITGVKPEEQIMQIKSYLYQLVEQLNWMLPTIESSTGQAGASTNHSMGDISAETFYELKSLLIKSSDTLNAYYEKINAKLEGQYVNQSDFNDHAQENAKSFADLANQYVAQTSYDAYKQEVAQQFDGLASQYVAQTAFDTFQAGLDSKYVSQTVYDEHTQEASQSIANLQQSVSDLQQVVGELQQLINSMQETGG